MVFALTCSATAAFNYYVDPYGLFGRERIRGFNLLKPKEPPRVRVVKAYEVLRRRPTTLIGGNSRPEMGLDPQSKCWDAAEKPVYNIGLPGAGLYMQALYLEEGIAAGSVKNVLWGIDLQDFLVKKKGPKDFSTWPTHPFKFESRLLLDKESAARWITHTEDMATALFSLNGAADSVVTLFAQRDPYSATRRTDGFNPAQDYMSIIATEGQDVLFRQKNREIIRDIADPDWVLFQNGGRWSTAFETLRRFLDYSRAHGVRVTLFINPYHADYLASFAVTGKWKLLGEWKRRLVTLLVNYSVPLWDFSDFDAYSMERPPGAGVAGVAMKWFWEPTHYRRRLGTLILGRMLHRRCGGIDDAQYGTLLTLNNIESRNHDVDRGLGRFKQAFPTTWKRLSQIADSFDMRLQNRQSNSNSPSLPVRTQALSLVTSGKAPEQ